MRKRRSSKGGERYRPDARNIRSVSENIWQAIFRVARLSWLLCRGGIWLVKRKKEVCLWLLTFYAFQRFPCRRFWRLLEIAFASIFLKRHFGPPKSRSRSKTYCPINDGINARFCRVPSRNADRGGAEIGRASCRERVCLYV